MIEAGYPLTVESYGYVPDTCEAGQFRGGLALTRRYRVDASDVTLQTRTDRMRLRPYGPQGGMPGTVTQNHLIRGGATEELAGKVTVTLQKGDVFSHTLAGAGGWSNPLDRDRQSIKADLRDVKISVRFAAQAFGYKN